MTDVKLPTHGRFRNITNQEFNRLTAKSFKGMINHRAVWNCECSCGKTIAVRSHNLLNGHTQSCGCYLADQTNKANTKHGCNRVGNRTAEYQTWVGMNRRCYDENEESYPDYGGRGITVCEEWQGSFTSFLNDMGPRQSSRQSIERKDNSLGYSKDNCKWATMKEQNRNKRNNRLFKIGSQTKCLAVWAEEYGIDQNTVGLRLDRGWSIERSLTEPIHANKINGKKVEFRGEHRSVADLSREFGIPYGTAKARIRMGWSLEKVFTKPIDVSRRRK